MSDHHNYCNNFLNEISIPTKDDGDSFNDSESIIGAEKVVMNSS